MINRQTTLETGIQRIGARTRESASPIGDPAAERGNRLQRLLTAELAGAGCMRLAPARSVAYGAVILGIYGAAYATLLSEPVLPLRILAIVSLALISVHAGFLAHEAGHGAITRNRRIAAAIGQVFNTLLTALSYSYFSYIHRQHHPHCNDRGRDPDMQSEFFSLYPQSAREKRGLGCLISRHQATLIWILVWLQGFTLKIDSLQYLRRNPRATRVDQVVMALHFALWFVPPALALGLVDAVVNYAVMTLLIGPYLGVIFLVNHIGTRVIESDEQLSHFEQEIAVTRNLGGTRWHDLVFGGINNHIEHHLFPALPTARLRTARRITREFCRRHGVAYRETTWLAAAREVTRHLNAMSACVPQ